LEVNGCGDLILDPRHSEDGVKYLENILVDYDNVTCGESRQHQNKARKSRPGVMPMGKSSDSARK